MKKNLTTGYQMANMIGPTIALGLFGQLCTWNSSPKWVDRNVKARAGGAALIVTTAAITTVYVAITAFEILLKPLALALALKGRCKAWNDYLDIKMRLKVITGLFLGLVIASALSIIFPALHIRAQFYGLQLMTATGPFAATSRGTVPNPTNAAPGQATGLVAAPTNVPGMLLTPPETTLITTVRTANIDPAEVTPFVVDRQTFTNAKSKLAQDKTTLTTEQAVYDKENATFKANQAQLVADQALFSKERAKLSEDNALLKQGQDKLAKDQQQLAVETSAFTAASNKLTQDKVKLAADQETYNTAKQAFDQAQSKLQQDEQAMKERMAKLESDEAAYQARLKVLQDNTKKIGNDEVTYSNRYESLTLAVNEAELKLKKAAFEGQVNMFEDTKGKWVEKNFTTDKQVLVLKNLLATIEDQQKKRAARAAGTEAANERAKARTPKAANGAGANVEKDTQERSASPGRAASQARSVSPGRNATPPRAIVEVGVMG